MTFRLECMTMDNDPPAMPGIHAESIILNLVNEPQCYLSSHFVKCIRSWQPFSLTYISEEERIALERAATIADDGIHGAIDELVKSEPGPLNMDRVRALRVAVALIQRHMEEDQAGCLDILQTGWKENVYGLFFCAVDIAFEVGQELQKQFSLTIPPPLERGLVEQFLLLADQLLRLIARLESFAITTIRTTRRLVDATFHVFSAADSALRAGSTLPCVRASGTRAKQACVHVLEILLGTTVKAAPKSRSAVILRMLLQKSRVVDGDPCQRIREILELVSCLFPTPSPDSAESNSQWMVSTISVILDDLENFLCILDVDQRCQLVGQLIALDNGVLNFGEWFVQQELKHMSDLSRFVMEGQTEHVRVMAQLTVNKHIRTLVWLMSPSCPHHSLCLQALSVIPGASRTIADVMTAFLNARVYSYSLQEFVRLLASSTLFTDSSVNIAIALTFIRGVSVPELHADISEAFDRAREILSTIDSAALALDRLLWEFGYCLSAIANSEEPLDPVDIRAIVLALHWLCEKLPGPSDLPGLSWDKWDTLCEAFENQATPEVEGFSKAIKGKLTPLPDSSMPTRMISDTVSMSTRDLEVLLQPSVPVPSTPKRKSPAQDVLGLVALSPPTALLRSPAISGLTKTYTRNDFRELRQTPSARQNTSRLPSMHVDVSGLFADEALFTYSSVSGIRAHYVISDY